MSRKSRRNRKSRQKRSVTKKPNRNFRDQVASQDSGIPSTPSQHINVTSVPRMLPQQDALISVAQDIYQRLLRQDTCFLAENHKYLISYIYNTIRKSTLDRESGIKDGNADSVYGHRAINTGLLDKFFCDIVLVLLNGNMGVKHWRVVTSKNELSCLGFSVYDIEHRLSKPVRYGRTAADLVFCGSLSEFDFSDTYRLHHIVEDRRDRFPVHLRSASIETLCNMIRTDIQNAVKLSERDYTYILPMYNFRSRSIQFLVPLYLGNPLGGRASLVAVVGKGGAYYTVYTVLSLSDAYCNAILVNPQLGSWLNHSTKAR